MKKNLIVLALLSGVACGDDDSAPTRPSGTTQLSSLSVTQAQDLCNEGVAEVSNTFGVTAICEVSGVAGAILLGEGSPEVCTATRDQCLQNPSTTAEDVFECSAISADDLTDCNATVAQFDACVDALDAQLSSASTTLVCSNLANITQADLAVLAIIEEDLSQIPECNTLLMACPNLL